jgi:hypothetical protein
MRFFAAVFLAVFAATTARAELIGVVETYDAKARTGTLKWPGSQGGPVQFTSDPGVPALKKGDRVRAENRPMRKPGMIQSPFMPDIIFVVGLETPDPKRPVTPPAPAPKPAPAPHEPMGEVKSFDAAKGVGIFVPDGQAAGREFRPWPGFDFRPMNGARLRWTEDAQFGQKILWVAPLEPKGHRLGEGYGSLDNP